MDIIIKKENSTVIATVTFDKAEWKDAQEKAYARLAANVTIPGFRKGKAPLDMAKKAIDGRKMIEKAVDILLPLGNEKVLKENQLDLLLRPEVDVKEVNDEKVVIDYIYTVRPDIKLGDYKGLKITKDAVEVTDEDVEAELKALQTKNVEVRVKEGAIELGNVANIDFKGFVNDVAFDGGEAKGYDLEIGSGAFIPGFEDQLVGAVAGQDLDLKVTFPEQYSKELAGKPAVFKVHVNSVSEKVYPEINDDLALDANIDGVGNLEELKQHLRNQVEERKTKEADSKAFGTLIETIVNASEVEISDKLVVEEAKNQLEGFKQQVAANGIPYDKYLEIAGTTEEALLENMKADAARNLKASFVLQEIAKLEKIDVSSDDIENEFKAISEQYNMELAKVKEALASRVNELANQVFQRKLSAFLREANEIA